MLRIIKKYKGIITIVIILCLVLGSIMIRKSLEEDNLKIEEDNIVKIDNEVENNDKDIIDITNVYVDIKGAIKNPGVYEIESDKRVIDVVNKAGGLSDNANTSFVNLAKKVEDSMVVIIYTNDEIEKAKKDDSITYVIDNSCVCPKIKNDACLENNTKKNDNKDNDDKKNDTTGNINDKININTASVLDLQTLPGIGESKAKAIIEYRDTEGNFSSIEDIKNVSGIGDSLYEKIKEYITV